MRNPSILTLIVTACLAASASAESGWTKLFNGKDLSGWTQRGGKATYAVEGDSIVGSSVVNTPNSFLCTEKTYGDFILEYEFKVDPRLNSGVQIRSEILDAPKEIEWDGKTKTIAAGRVHGYQVEIDPDPKKDRWWSAGIYDEGRRGWLYPGALGGEAAAFTEQGRKIFKQGDWNTVRVEAVGDSIKTFLNGEPRASIQDSMTPRGVIGLQVHSIGKNKQGEGLQVAWRNLRIKEVSGEGSPSEQASNSLSDAEKADGWKLLWNGKDTEGWCSAKSDSFPEKGWAIEDGVLTVLASGGGESKAGGDIITRNRYSDFELLADFKITPGANSGIKYFVQPNLSPIDKVTGKPTGVGSAIGVEFQILDDANHPDARKGKDGNRTIGSLYDLIPAASTKKPSAIGEWNTARILSRGNHVEHWLNGQKVVEYERGSPEFREIVAGSKYKDISGFGEWPDGHILLQDHGNRVSFRNIKIRVPATK